MGGFKGCAVFELADKRDNISAGMASEAIEDLFVGAHCEGGCFFAVKRAASLEVYASTLERYMVADD